MAAEMAVEIMAQETALTEDSQAKVEHSAAIAQEDHSVRAEIVREDHSAKVQIAQEDRLERTLREEALAEIVLEEALVRTQREEASAATVQEDHSVKTQSVQEDSSVRAEIVQENHSARIQREEALAETEDHLLAAEAASTQLRRASTRRISITSVTRMRAESTR
jgi:hypothetical protein